MNIQLKPLLINNPLEPLSKFLISLQESARFIKNIKKDGQNIVDSEANRKGSLDTNRAIQSGLLYLALTEPEMYNSLCTDIILTSRDQLTHVLSELARLVAETWIKMPFDVKQNLLNLVKELISTRGTNIEVLMLHLMRRIISGDLSYENVWLAQKIVEIFDSFKDWLENPDRQPFLLLVSVFTLLRITPDHLQPLTIKHPELSLPVIDLVQLSNKEVEVLLGLLKRKFDRCTELGRDFVRMLMQFNRLPAFEEFFKELTTNISSLTSLVSDFTELLYVETPRLMLGTLIPHEMEIWIRWLMKNVHCVSGIPVRKYQELFNRRFFTSPENNILRVNLVRYIVTSFYPDNEMLGSTLIPRWNVISWLITQSTCPQAKTNAIIALFYDWLFFRPNDCIMNVAMMNHVSQRGQPISVSLSEFLVNISYEYMPMISQKIVLSVRAGLHDMIRVGVIKSIGPLIDLLNRVNSQLARRLMDLIGSSDGTSRPITPPPGNFQNAPLGSRPADPRLIKQQNVNQGIQSQIRAPGKSLDSFPINSKSQNTSLNSSMSIVSPTTSPSSSRTNTPPDISSVPSPCLDPESIAGKNSSDRLLSDEDLNELKNSPMQAKVLLNKQSEKPVKKSSQSRQIPDSFVARKISSTSLKSDTIPERSLGDFYRSPSSIDLLFSNPNIYQDKIDDLRRAFQEYNFRFHHLWKSNPEGLKPVDVHSEINQIDDVRLRDALHSLLQVAVKVGLYTSNISSDDSKNLNGFEKNLPNPTKVEMVCEALETVIDAIFDCETFEEINIAGRTAIVLITICEPLFKPTSSQNPLKTGSCSNHLGSPTQITDEQKSSASTPIEGSFSNSFWHTNLPCGYSINEEILEEALASPVFIPFKHLCHMSASDNKRDWLLLLLAEMHVRQPRVGYHLLYYLKLGKVNDEKMDIYRNFCASKTNTDVRHSIHQDMRLLSEDNMKLFTFLIPDVYRVFRDLLSNDVEFLHLVISSLDPNQVNHLVCEIIRGQLDMFPHDDLSLILRSTLDWSSFEQIFFWQLVSAHELPTKKFIPLMLVVDFHRHPEACAQLLLLLQLEKPTLELVKTLLTRSVATSSSTGSRNNMIDDQFATTALHYWSSPEKQHSSRFALLLSQLIHLAMSGKASLSANESGRGRAKISVDHSGLGLSNILGHLDCMRRTCKNIAFLQDLEIQSTLRSVAQSSSVSEKLKAHFAELLALVEDSEVSNKLASGQKRFSVTETQVIPEGKKGGHSLRKLDSRRAAEAEKRQQTSPLKNSTSNLKSIGDKSKRSSSKSKGLLKIVEDTSDENEASDFDSQDSSSNSEGKQNDGQVPRLRSFLNNEEPTSSSSISSDEDIRKEKSSNSTKKDSIIDQKEINLSLLGSNSDVSSDDDSSDNSEQTEKISAKRKMSRTTTKGVSKRARLIVEVADDGDSKDFYDSKRKSNGSKQDSKICKHKDQSIEEPDRQISKISKPILENITSSDSDEDNIKEGNLPPRQLSQKRNSSQVISKIKRAAASRPVSYFEGDVDGSSENDEEPENENLEDHDSDQEVELKTSSRKKSRRTSQASSNSRKFFYE